tara:strand:+ start:2642 stop:3703 length:1062 start_codon:yes stop_codon:yes gene_type:complete
MIQLNNQRGSVIVVATIFLLMGAVAAAVGLWSLHQRFKHSKQLELALADDRKMSSLAKQVDFSVYSQTPHVLDSLSEHKALYDYLLDTDDSDAKSQVELLFEWSKDSLSANAIYLLSKDGIVLVSTLASDQSNLEGADLSFRPYFDAALKGQAIVYPALGTKTGVRGLYFSKGVRLPGSPQIDAVMVIKMNLGLVDDVLLELQNPIALVSKDGVVFASNRSHWLYGTIRPLSDEQKQQLKLSQQFAQQSLDFIGVPLDLEEVIVNNITYRTRKLPLSLQDFELITLQPSQLNTETQLSNFQKLFITYGSIFVALCLLLGLCALMWISSLKERADRLELILTEIRSLKDRLRVQ